MDPITLLFLGSVGLYLWTRSASKSAPVAAKSDGWQRTQYTPPPQYSPPPAPPAPPPVETAPPVWVDNPQQETKSDPTKPDTSGWDQSGDEDDGGVEWDQVSTGAVRPRRMVIRGKKGRR